MYESFFGLKRRPFAATPDPQCFLASESIQSALDEIVVCLEQGQGIAIVSAPAGTGKTLLCERLRNELGSPFESVLLRHASFLTRRALLQTILCELSHAYRQQDEQELRLELIPAIRALRPQREALVLICDEAHQLSEELLEELRILSDLAEQGRPLVRLVLVGQLSLEETLARPGLEALNQRIRAHVCLETLDRAGSLDYIDYRLTWAGGRTEEVFSPAALDLVCRAADGVPRCLNQLCDHALLLAYVAEQQPVPPAMIREALNDLRQLPLHWNETSTFEPTRRNSASLEHDSASLETVADTLASGAHATVTEYSTLTEYSFEDRASRESQPNVESFEIGVDLPRHVPQPIPPSVRQLEASRVEPPPLLVETTAYETTAYETTAYETAACETTEFGNLVACNNTRVCEFGFEACDDHAVEETLPTQPFQAEVSADSTADSATDRCDSDLTDDWSHCETGVDAVSKSDSSVSRVCDTASARIESASHDPLAAITILATRLPARGGFTEELVLDRYAAIDAGLEPVEAIEVAATTDSTDEIHATVIEAERSESDAQESAVSGADIDFRAACARLHERLPQVADEAAWDSNLFRNELLAEYTDDASNERDDDEDRASANSDTLEEILGAEVCELVQELQQTMGLPSRPRSPVEQLRSLLTSAPEMPASTMSCETSAAQSDVAVCERPATATNSTAELNPPASEETSTRPYRNLFSILRRKQQGLI